MGIGEYIFMAESTWILPFGKRYKNYCIEDVPSSYLEFLLEQDWFCEKFEDKIKLVEEELKFRNKFDLDYEED